MTLDEWRPPTIPEAVDVWLAAIESLRAALRTGEHHEKLSLRSFEIGNPDRSETPVVTILDRELIVRSTRRATPSSAPDLWEYAAPEQTGVLGDAVDVRSNVYSLGAIGFRLVTGRLPYPDGPLDELPIRIARGAVVRPSDLTGAHSDALRTLLSRAMELDRSLRYQSIDELQRAAALLAPYKPELTTLLVGRDDEIAIVRAELAAARAGTGRTISITGEAGIGKSALVCAVEAAESGDPVRWIRRKCAQSGSTPYGTVGAIIDELVRAVGLRESANLTSWAGGGVRAVLSRVCDAVPLGPGAGGFIDETHHAGDGIADELARLVCDMAGAIGGAVLVIDDVQWIDAQSRQTIGAISAIGASRLALMLVGRPQSRDVAPPSSISRRIRLEGLSRADSRSLVATGLRRDAPGSAGAEASIAKAIDASRGNPLALLTLGTALVDGSFVKTFDAPVGGTVGEESLAALALSRLDRLDSDTRCVLRAIALLAPPVAGSLLAGVDIRPCRDAGIRARSIDIARSLLLVTVSGDDGDPTIGFAHDTIELAARRDAHGDRATVGAAHETLERSAEAGSVHAIFALARFYAGSDGEPWEIPAFSSRPRSEQRTLAIAAEKAAELFAAADALRYAEAALGRGTEWLDPDARLRLHVIAHESAYRLDEVATMSRHFRPIRAIGDPIRVNRARSLWISRAIARSSFASAVSIGTMALTELGESLPAEPEARVTRSAELHLRLLRLTAPARRLAHRRPSQSNLAGLIVEICTRLLFSAYVMRSDLIPILIRIILGTSFRHGLLRQTGVAFLYWTLLISRRTVRRRGCYRMGAAARRFALKADEYSRATIEAGTLFLSEHWVRDVREVAREAADVHLRALACGNVEWAGHAAHLACVIPLLSGEPLYDLLPIIHDYRSRLASLGLRRTERAITKYEQVCECVMGEAASPVELTGAYIHQRSEISNYERTNDLPGLYGMYTLGGLLAVYGDLPQRGLVDLRRASELESVTAPLPDTPVFTFHLGFCAWREGAHAEARRATRRLRIWSQVSPQNQRHRYLLLLAERARHRGRYRPALARYRTAADLAVARGNLHESALASERLADLLADRGRHGQARSAWYRAFALYTRWGARHAADRVRARLGWSERLTGLTPVLAEQRFLERLATAEAQDTICRLMLDEVVRLAAVQEAYLFCCMGDDRSAYQHASDPDHRLAITRIAASELPARVSGLIENAGPDPMIVRTDAGSSILVCRSRPSTATDVAVALVSRGEQTVSSAVAARVKGVVTVGAAILAMRHATSTVHEASVDLDLARSVVASTRANQRILLDTIPVGLLLLDSDGNVLVANPAADRYLYADGTGALRVRSAITEAIAGWNPSRGNRVDIVDGERSLRLTGNSTPQLTAVSIEDVTELRYREAEVERQRGQLVIADRMASLGMLAASIAHEVGNPNHVLQLNLQSLLLTLGQVGPDGDASRELLERAEGLATHTLDASHRIAEVIEGVKEYGRGGREAGLAKVDPNEAAARAYRFSKILAAQHTDRFELIQPNMLPRIDAIPGRIEQAIVNLIRNACEALPNRTCRVVVSTAVDDAAGRICVRVSDQGSGLPGSAAPTDPFDSGRAGSGGTGLGLSIVRTILDEHGGELVYRSDDEFATIAEMWLPAAGQA